MGLQRSVPESAISGWVRPVRQEQAQGVSFAALGMSASPSGLRRPPEQAASPCKSSPSGWPSARRPSEEVANDLP
jgi:hypothetical protein